MIPKEEIEAHGTEPSSKNIVDILRGGMGMTIQEISQELNLSIPGTSSKMNRLYEEGEVQKKKYNGVYHYYVE